jgi:hypothetical protein
LLAGGKLISYDERLANNPRGSSGSNKDMTSSSRAAPHRSRGRFFLLLGLGLAVLGVAAYVVQISLQRLMTPWYMPILASLGVVLVVLSLWERRTVWRVFALLAIVLLAGAECAFLFAMRLPPYTGPIAEGRPFPAFETRRADGTPFTQRDLTGDRSNVLVFFRGRW